MQMNLRLDRNRRANWATDWAELGRIGPLGSGSVVGPNWAAAGQTRPRLVGKWTGYCWAELDDWAGSLPDWAELLDPRTGLLGETRTGGPSGSVAATSYSEEVPGGLLEEGSRKCRSRGRNGRPNRERVPPFELRIFFGRIRELRASPFERVWELWESEVRESGRRLACGKLESGGATAVTGSVVPARRKKKRKEN
ncbi:hypothetical protein CRG98_000600 [Punica granatum]|uniref:Uncharacterized protein n=1 Tax=Punica granatum TaxID=22663 RepID=A0A2I0LE75_PUNGR|nr:hypothetical protein CRG98_000600 [Punica granatum]